MEICFMFGLIRQRFVIKIGQDLLHMLNLFGLTESLLTKIQAFATLQTFKMISFIVGCGVKAWQLECAESKICLMCQNQLLRNVKDLLSLKAKTILKFLKQFLRNNYSDLSSPSILFFVEFK